MKRWLVQVSQQTSWSFHLGLAALVLDEAECTGDRSLTGVWDTSQWYRCLWVLQAGIDFLWGNSCLPVVLTWVTLMDSLVHPMDLDWMISLAFSDLSIYSWVASLCVPGKTHVGGGHWEHVIGVMSSWHPFMLSPLVCFLGALMGNILLYPSLCDYLTTYEL